MTEIDTTHATYLEARRQTQLLRTIRTVLLVWSVVAGVGIVAGLVWLANAVAPY